MAIENTICAPETHVVGQGQITAEAVRQDVGSVIDNYGDHQVTRTNKADVYAFAATPAQGWRFDHFEVETTYDVGQFVGTTSETHRTEQDVRPFVAGSPFTTNGLGDDNTASASATCICETYTGGRYHDYCKTLAYIITAVFVRIPTDLLVNSSSLGSPVKLVYDPSTNKLVCDA